MRSKKIQKLIEIVSKAYGNVELYGSTVEEEHGTCFKLAGIPAIFSLHTQDGELESSYDVQIEGIPAGNYVYTTEVSLEGLMDLLKKYELHESQWP